MNFDPRSVLLVAGQMFIVMAMAVLAILFRRHARLNLLAWTAASMAMGLTACLLALRDTVPDWLSLPVANALVYAGFLLMAQVLRLERGLPSRWGQTLALWLLATGLFSVAWATPWPSAQRLVLTGVLQIAGATLVALQAWRLALQTGSISARLIGLAYAAYAATLALRALRLALGLTDGLAVSPQPDFLAAVLAALLAALFGSVGYLGMALDRARQRDLAQREALEQLREAQRSQELSARAAQPCGVSGTAARRCWRTRCASRCTTPRCRCRWPAPPWRRCPRPARRAAPCSRRRRSSAACRRRWTTPWPPPRC